jgi:MFS family permease
LKPFAWLKEEPQFRYVLAANFISGMGDWFNSVAVLSLVLNLTGAAMAVGVTLALRTLPYLILGPYAGVLADKGNRKHILMWANLGSSVVALLFLFVTTPSRVWVVYAATLGLVVFSALMNPAKMAIVPQIVAPNNLIRANALNQTVNGIVMAAGSFVGGVVTAALGVDVAFVLNALSFLAAAALFARIRLPKPALDDLVKQDARSKPTAGFREVWHLLWLSRPFLLVVLMFLLWPVGGGIVNVLLSVYAVDVFHAGNAGVGVMYGSLGLGFILGGLLSSRFATRLKLAAVLGFVVEGAAHAVMSQVPTLLWAAVLLTLATIGAGVGDTCLETILMQIVPNSLQGRVLALLSSASNVLLSIFMIIGGALLNVVAPRLLGLLAGALIALAAIAAGCLLRIHDSGGEAAQEASGSTA